MTRLISVKNASDLPEVFKDKVSFQVVDDNLESVLFTIGDETIRIVSKDNFSNTLKVLIREPESPEPVLDYEYDEPSPLSWMRVQ